MIIYGAGGHARVVFESLLSTGIDVKAVIDDDLRIEFFEGLQVFHGYNSDYFKDEKLIISIGSNKIREELYSIIRHKFGQVFDPTSFIAKSANVGDGSMILAKSILQSGVAIGNHVIVNSGAVVEHDSQVRDFCHLGPGSVVCGEVTVGKGTLVGANVTVLPGVEIGEWSIIGAGSVVVGHVPSGVIVAGNPAKLIEM